MRDLLGSVFLDSKLIQRNVWYWRRMDAGHLSSPELKALAQQYPFDGQTVARADQAFFALYGREPEPQEWTSSYLVILQHLAQDPDFYTGTTSRTNQSQMPVRLRIQPRTTKLHRVVHSRVDRSGMAMMMLAMILVFVGGTVVITCSDEDVNMTSVVFMAGLFLVVGFGAAFMSRATDISYVCPECGQQYGMTEIARCEHCWLEFAPPPPLFNPKFTFQEPQQQEL